MAYISLYRKYRPHTFKDVVGQEVVVKILKNSILSNKIGHAYVFSGPRGTGKTSIAKIFAKAVNCNNSKDGDVCKKCDACLLNIDECIDIIEIDAASNNGVDEIREIRNNISMLPSTLKYKVYIIDEVHMLSKSAFNALLKTLEEPPSHAIFILATTEIDEIPATVLSRCQRFDFKKITKKNISSRLKYILEQENKLLDEKIVELISDLSDGGLRDAINLLDQVLSLNKLEITQTDVYNLIGEVPEDSLFELLEYLTEGNIKEVINKIDEFYNTESNFIVLVEKLENFIKDILIFNTTSNYFDKNYEDKLYKFSRVDSNILIKVSEELFNLTYDLKKSLNHKIVSEIYFLKITILFNNKNNVDNKNKVIDESAEKNSSKVENDLIANKDFNTDDNSSENKKILINNALSCANKALKNDFISNFNQIDNYVIKKEYNSIAELLKKSVPEVVSDNNLIFTFKNNFEVLLFEKNVEEVAKLLKLIYNKKYDLVAITNDEWKTIKEEYIKNINAGIKYEYIKPEIKKTKKATKKIELVNSVENIFGENYITED